MNVIPMFSPLKHLKGRDLLLNGFLIKGTVTRSYRMAEINIHNPLLITFLLRSHQKFGSGNDL